MEPKTIETIIIGIIAKNMGYCNQTNVCESGHEILSFIGRLTNKEFLAIKKQLKNDPARP